MEATVAAIIIFYVVVYGLAWKYGSSDSGKPYDHDREA